MSGLLFKIISKLFSTRQYGSYALGKSQFWVIWPQCPPPLPTHIHNSLNGTIKKIVCGFPLDSYICICNMYDLICYFMASKFDECISFYYHIYLFYFTFLSTRLNEMCSKINITAKNNPLSDLKNSKTVFFLRCKF